MFHKDEYWLSLPEKAGRGRAAGRCGAGGNIWNSLLEETSV